MVKMACLVTRLGSQSNSKTRKTGCFFFVCRAISYQKDPVSSPVRPVRSLRTLSYARPPTYSTFDRLRFENVQSWRRIPSQTKANEAATTHKHTHTHPVRPSKLQQNQFGKGGESATKCRNDCATWKTDFCTGYVGLYVTGVGHDKSRKQRVTHMLLPALPLPSCSEWHDAIHDAMQRCYGEQIKHRTRSALMVYVGPVLYGV